MLTIYLHCYKPPLGLQLNSKVCNLHIYLSFLTLCTQDVAHFCAVYPYLLLPAPLEQVACLSTQACIYPFPAPLTLSMLYTHISTSPHIISYSTLIINVRYYRHNHTPLNTWSEVDECCKKPHLWERLSCPITHVHTWRMIQPPLPPQQSNWLQARQGCRDERLGARDLLLRCAYWWLPLLW
jgi:hypothetical protein